MLSSNILDNEYCKGHLLHEWRGLKRTRTDIDENFLLRQFHKANYVTAYYEDAQDYFSAPDVIWTPSTQQKKKPSVTPALYYSRQFMKVRYAIKKDIDPVCINGKSSNAVSPQM